jgi:nicotinamide riboside kinase
MLKKIVVLGPESTGKSTLCQMLANHFNTLWCPEFARQYLLTNGTAYTFDDLLTIAKGQLALEEEYVQMVGSQEDGKTERREDGKTERREDGKTGSREDGKTGSQEDGNTGRREDGKARSPEVFDFSTHQNAFGLSDLPTPKLLFLDTDQYVMKVWCEYVFNDCHNWILRRIAERSYDLYLLCKPDLPWVKDELREYPDEKPRQELYHIYRDLLINQHTPWVEISGSHEDRFAVASKAVKALI